MKTVRFSERNGFSSLGLFTRADMVPSVKSIRISHDKTFLTPLSTNAFKFRSYIWNTAS